MSTNAEFKFAWIYALAADESINEAFKYVGIMVALRNLDLDAPTFRVRQSTIATTCGTSIRTVKRAYQRLRESGWIVLNQRRSGAGGADQYRLAIPNLGANLTPSYGDLGDSNGQPRGLKRSSKVTQTVNLGDRAETVTSGNGVPKGIYKGFEKGFGKGTAASAAPIPDLHPNEEKISDTEPPQRYCTPHMPNGADENCGACGRRERDYQAWKEREPQRRQTRAAARAAAQLACRHCDHGWLLGGDGTPLEPAVKCPHCTPDQLREGA